jgi:hypothetical protein
LTDIGLSFLVFQGLENLLDGLVFFGSGFGLILINQLLIQKYVAAVSVSMALTLYFSFMVITPFIENLRMSQLVSLRI